MKYKLLVILFFVLGWILPLHAQTSGTCGKNLTWSLSNGVLTITGTGDMYDYYTNQTPWSSSAESIRRVTITAGVTSIGKYTFEDCSSLTSVTIGSSVTSIGKCAFYKCSSLTSVTIPNSVTSIGYGAFQYCSGLTSVTIPNSVTSIGEHAFYACSGLTSLTIGSSVTSIGKEAFYGCSGLTSLTIPNSVTSIGNRAFEYCKGLTSITIGDGVTSIGSEAFRSCSDLIYIVINDGNTVYDSRNYCDAIIETASNTLITGCKNTTIPNSVTSIGDYAFEGCSGLTSVTIPNNVVSIGDKAFYDCKGLTSITIPNSVTSIGTEAFRFCNGLTSPLYNLHVFAYMPTSYSGAYTIPNGIANIAGGAFESCTGLTSVTIPNSVTSIGDYAFYGCRGLTSIFIPNSVTSIGNFVFRGCRSLTSPIYNSHVFAFMPESYSGAYTIPSGIENVSGSAFENCTGLSSVTIGNSVTSIGDYAFEYCSGLTSVTIPNSVTSIGYYAFRGCSSLTSVEFLNPIPPFISGKNPFYGTTCQFYVPCGNKDAYLAALNDTDNYYIVADSLITEKSPYSCQTHSNNTSFGTVTITQEPTCINPTLVVTATPTNNNRYGFSKWSDGISENPRTIVLTSDTTLYAEFYDKSDALYLLSLNYDSSKGYVIGGGAYPHNSYVTLTAYPADGYRFEKWGDGATYNPTVCYLESDMQVEAFFVPVSEDLESAHAHSFSAYTVGQTLYVDNVDAPYTVINANGSTVYSGRESAVNLPAQGIYVVICNGDAIKVIAK